jgi:pimeloyl-ACP methyl ester carboxylesterase
MTSLVVWGEDDRFVPLAHGEAFAARLPGCQRFEIVRDAGHSVVLEQPDKLAALVAAHIAKTG